MKKSVFTRLNKKWQARQDTVLSAHSHIAIIYYKGSVTATNYDSFHDSAADPFGTETITTPTPVYVTGVAYTNPYSKKIGSDEEQFNKVSTFLPGDALFLCHISGNQDSSGVSVFDKTLKVDYVELSGEGFSVRDKYNVDNVITSGLNEPYVYWIYLSRREKKS